MERIRERLTRSHRTQRAGVDELTKHRQTGAGASYRRQLRIQKKVYSSLHCGSAPQIDVGRLIAAGDPESLSILNMAADVGGVSARNAGDDDGFDRIHLRAELLDVRVVGVCARSPNHD